MPNITAKMSWRWPIYRHFVRAGNKAIATADWPRAYEKYLIAVAIEPHATPIWVQLGHAAKEMGNAAVAVEHYRKAVALGSTDIHAANFIARPGVSGAEAIKLSHLADAARNSGDFARAVNLYEAVIKLNPGHFDTLLSLGTCLREIQQYDRAGVIFQHAISIKEDEPHAYLQYGIVRKIIGDYATARELFTKANVLNSATQGLATELREIDALADAQRITREEAVHSTSIVNEHALGTRAPVSSAFAGTNATDMAAIIFARYKEKLIRRRV